MPEGPAPVRWPCPGAATEGEWALSSADPAHRRGNSLPCVLIVPPLFDEMNRTRHMLAGVMRLLAQAGIDSVLPDLPGCGESVQDFSAQSLNAWRAAMEAAARHFAASHVLTLRGGALVAPPALPGWELEPCSGHALLRTMLRAHTFAQRAAGRRVDSAALLEQGRETGLELAGYRCGAALIAGLCGAEPAGEGRRVLSLSDLGQSAPWLRAEPAPAPALAQALVATIRADLAREDAA